MERTAKNGLGVFWHHRSREGGRDVIWPEEVAGFRAIGFWPHSQIPDLAEFEGIRTLWPGDSVETKSRTMHDVDNEDLIRHLTLTFWIKQWPSPTAWMKAIEDSLRFLADRGASIAWCEPESGILMYDTATDFAGCYAAYTPHTGFFCSGGLNDPLRFLSSDPAVVAKLHAALRQRVADEV